MLVALSPLPLVCIPCSRKFLSKFTVFCLEFAQLVTPLTVLGQACHGNHMPCHAQVFVIIEVADMATNLTTATDTLEVKTNFRGVQTARDAGIASGPTCRRARKGLIR